MHNDKFIFFLRDPSFVNPIDSIFLLDSFNKLSIFIFSILINSFSSIVLFNISINLFLGDIIILLSYLLLYFLILINNPSFGFPVFNSINLFKSTVSFKYPNVLNAIQLSNYSELNIKSSISFLPI